MFFYLFGAANSIYHVNFKIQLMVQGTLRVKGGSSQTTSYKLTWILGCHVVRSKSTMRSRYAKPDINKKFLVVVNYFQAVKYSCQFLVFFSLFDKNQKASVGAKLHRARASDVDL